MFYSLDVVEFNRIETFLSTNESFQFSPVQFSPVQSNPIQSTNNKNNKFELQVKKLQKEIESIDTK